MNRRRIDPTRYRQDPTNPRIRHLDGIPWNEAPKPPRLHLCRAQSQGWENLLDFTRRCACGAVKQSGAVWSGRNSRHP